MQRKILLYILSAAIGITFLFSAIVKLFPVEMLEFAIVETGLFSWKTASIFARLLISSEIFLGLMLIFRLLPRATIILAFIELGIFSIYLIWLFISAGNEGNCNCFGIYFIMSPVESLIKNIGIIGLLIILYLYTQKRSFRKPEYLFAILVIAISVTIPFALNPIYVGTQQQLTEKGTLLELDKIYNDPNTEKPQKDLRTGKQLLLFVSANCQHCIAAAYKIHVLQNNIPELPVYLFINGDDEEITEFHTLTRTQNIPQSKLDAAPMVFYTGGKLPAIFLITDGIIDSRHHHLDLDESVIYDWLND